MPDGLNFFIPNKVKMRSFKNCASIAWELLAKAVLAQAHNLTQIQHLMPLLT